MKQLKVCFVCTEKPYPAFSSTLSILKEICGSENVKELRVKNLFAKIPFIFKPIYALLHDLALFFKIISYHKKYGVNAILMFHSYYPLTCIGLKFSGLKILLYLGGSAFESVYFREASVSNRILAYFNILLQEICHRCSVTLIILSEKMSTQLNLQKYANKVRSAIGRINRDFFNEFRVIKGYKKRKNLVGYVGNLAKGKGILNLFEGIRIIVNNFGDEAPHFLIIGGGELYSYLKNKLDMYKLSKHVLLAGRMPHKALPKYYNEMKLLILPSYTEGIPSVILEAMACGTPVLATPVGAIPDVIKDGETGFLLKSNDPKQIADKIIELLNKPELLEKVSKNAYNHVRENFSYEKILESWRKIIREIEVQK